MHKLWDTRITEDGFTRRKPQASYNSKHRATNTAYQRIDPSSRTSATSEPSAPTEPTTCFCGSKNVSPQTVEGVDQDLCMDCGRLLADKNFLLDDSAFADAGAGFGTTFSFCRDPTSILYMRARLSDIRKRTDTQESARDALATFASRFHFSTAMKNSALNLYDDTIQRNEVFFTKECSKLALAAVVAYKILRDNKVVLSMRNVYTKFDVSLRSFRSVYYECCFNFKWQIKTATFEELAGKFATSEILRDEMELHYKGNVEAIRKCLRDLKDLIQKLVIIGLDHFVFSRTTPDVAIPVIAFMACKMLVLFPTFDFPSFVEKFKLEVYSAQDDMLKKLEIIVDTLGCEYARQRQGECFQLPSRMCEKMAVMLYEVLMLAGQSNVRTKINAVLKSGKAGDKDDVDISARDDLITIEDLETMIEDVCDGKDVLRKALMNSEEIEGLGCLLVGPDTVELL